MKRKPQQFPGLQFPVLQRAVGPCIAWQHSGPRRGSGRRPGLILLVVLGMLALFSMLAVTYVVFSSQSRAASVALVRTEIRDNKSRRSLMDEAIKELIRGSTNPESAVQGHDLLGDLYGNAESVNPALFSIRSRQFDPETGAPSGMNYDPVNGLQRPLLLNGHYLRIPLEPVDYFSPPVLPTAHDALNGRIVTFPEGNGPLSGQSFHIVRYIGQVPTMMAPISQDQRFQFSQCYSITIDLAEGDLDQVYSGVDAATGNPITLSVRDWVTAVPPVSGVGSWAAGVYACYNFVDLTNSRLLNNGHFVMVNAAPLNTHGIGILADGSSQLHELQQGAHVLNGTEVNQMAVALQPRYLGMLDPSTLNAGSAGVLTIEPGAQRTLAGASVNDILGDSDEPYDAADYQNFFLAYRETGADTPDEIIPSFHRASLINYIVNWKNPTTWTEVEFLATLRRIELAMGRPLSINIQVPSGTYVTNPSFSGGNAGAVGRTPQLNMTVGSWANWPNGGWPVFQQWLNFLTLGPWDVDNDLDGTLDSVWVDAGLPLETSADGTLLKALVSYYVMDLDNKLDINATGNIAQSNRRGRVPVDPNWFGFPYPVADQYGFALADASFHNGALAEYLPQGNGVGPAETSFRHLFSKSPNFLGSVYLQEYAYQDFLTNRYRRNDAYAGEIFPGNGADDSLSQLWHRERLLAFRHGSLPGLPYSPTGRASLGIDRLGNPMVWNVNATINETTNDPYEARLIGEPYQDLPISLAQWERIYRIGDPDRTSLPSRLQDLFGENPLSIATSTLRHEITPVSRYLRVPLLGGRGEVPDSAFAGGAPGIPTVRGPASFMTLINTLRELKDESTVPVAAVRNLFPLEFSRGLAMDLNRPFANGIDDDGDGEIDEPNEFMTDQGGSQGVTYTGQLSRYVNAAGGVGYVAGVLENYFEANQFDQTLSMQQKMALLGVDPNVSYTGGSPTNPIFWGQETRQLYARHLYCLAQLIVPHDYMFPSISKPYYMGLLQRERDTSISQAERDTASATIRNLRGRILAQWAVNVVDFRDADSVMTRFPYDPDPFRDVSGADSFVWDIAQGGSTNVVWGMEQPELLLTESLATHDTRVRHDAMANPKRFDQYRTPQGSLFLEFFCPRSTAYGAASGDNQQATGAPSSLYTTRGSAEPRPGSVALDLGRLTPALTGFARFPVWRVYISGPTDITSTPMLKTPNQRLMANPHNPGGAVNRHELTYQFAEGNWQYSASGVVTQSQTDASHSGLAFDLAHDANEALQPPQPDDSRILLFARDPADSTMPFIPTFANCPGVADPDAQVFVNRTGPRSLLGGQYLVVGPRPETYFGSMSDAPTRVASGPTNVPNPHRVTLDFGGGTELGAGTTGDWLRMYKPDSGLAVNQVDQRATLADCVTMVAAADAPSGWTSGSAAGLVGLNVSEPLVNDTNYYQEPTDRLNMADTDGDTNGPTGADGFANLPYDAYHDFGTSPSPPGPIPPFDRGQAGTPLENWDPDGDGNLNFADLDNDMNLGSGDVVEAGTQMDWSTAYLQRLADPGKPWHPTFNPYITVDWIPIDLTVFHGEDDDADLDPTGDVRFASRQKVGQTLNATTLAFNTAGPTGQTFLSAMTDEPRVTPQMVAPPAPAPFWPYEIVGDDGTAVRPTMADGTNAFATLGFLNSGYKLAGQDLNVPSNPVAVPSRFLGAPVNPTGAGNWHPDSLFWANRSFVNPYELMWVPTCSPGQLTQEFSATPSGGSVSVYAGDFRNDDTSGASASFLPQDPRTPASPISPNFTGMWPNDAGPEWPQPPTNQPPIAGSLNTGLTVMGTNIEPGAYTPYSYLLNFFQEVPELALPNQNWQTDTNNDRHPKNLSLSTLFDLVETPSPWIDAYRTETPANLQWQDYTTVAGGFQAVMASENILFAPLRAPNNRLPTYVEPGRVNLNTVAEKNVLQGVMSNFFDPSDIDFPPLENPSRPFGQVEDIDHNGNGVLDTPGFASGQRHLVDPVGGTGAITTMFTNLENSRRGYDSVSGGYTPGYNPDPLRFNPFFPTRFANPFRPAYEAGMVPKTRNPFPLFPLSPSPNPTPGSVGYDAAFVEHQRMYRLADEKGVLDMYTRLNPANATLLRSQTVAPFNSQDMDNNTLNVDTAGIYRPDATPLFSSTAPVKNHPHADLYPITRISNLVSGRSNVFAVYATIGLFEYDEATDQVGLEYKADRGEAQRYRAFYVIDRSRPVGYQVGEDHNVENTILVRRYIDVED